MLDAENIIFQADPNLFRNERPHAQARFTDLAAQNPRLSEPLNQRAATLVGNTLLANVIVIKLRPDASPDRVAQRIARWQHLDVYTAARSVNMQLMGSNRLILFQLSVFRDFLVLIAGIIIGLIIYTFTLDKLHDLAVLKLLGTPDGKIYRMILQQAILMGVIGTILGGAFELASEPYFPRRVVATYGDIAEMLLAMTIVAVLASILAVRRATTVDPRSVLGT
jgi:putative ABC transport system permease protein